EVSDAKAFADEVVQSHAAREDVSPRARRVQVDAVLGRERLERLGLDERELARGVALVEVAVALEPLRRDRPHGVDLFRELAVLRADVDGLDHTHARNLPVAAAHAEGRLDQDDDLACRASGPRAVASARPGSRLRARRRGVRATDAAPAGARLERVRRE